MPDVHTLQSQLAALVEKGDGQIPVGELRPLLEFLRVLLNARALALLPVAEGTGLASCVVTTGMPSWPASARNESTAPDARIPFPAKISGRLAFDSSAMTPVASSRGSGSRTVGGSYPRNVLGLIIAP